MKKLVNNFCLIVASFFASATAVFAENDSEFFEAAEGITLPTDETATGAVAPTVENVAEQAQQAQQGGNALEPIKEFFANFGGNLQSGWQGFCEKLQGFANIIGDKLNGLTGGNPLVSKIVVALVLVLISIVIIVVLVLIAKKFVHKTTSNPFQSQPFGKVGEIEDLDDIDDIDDVDEEKIDVGQENSNNVKNDESTVNTGIKEPVTSEEQITLRTPTDIAGAMKNFLNITE